MNRRDVSGTSQAFDYHDVSTTNAPRSAPDILQVTKAPERLPSRIVALVAVDLCKDASRVHVQEKECPMNSEAIGQV